VGQGLFLLGVAISYIPIYSGRIANWVDFEVQIVTRLILGFIPFYQQSKDTK